MSQTYEEMEQRRVAFSAELIELIGRYRDVMGPQIDPITEQPCDHDRDETCSCGLPTSALLNEWVLLSNWTDISKNRGNGEWSHVATSPGMIMSHKKGLLFTHLYG